MRFILQHTTLGWCLWDLAALAVLLGVCAYAYFRLKEVKKEVAELEAQASGNTVPVTDEGPAETA